MLPVQRAVMILTAVTDIMEAFSMVQMRLHNLGGAQEQHSSLQSRNMFDRHVLERTGEVTIDDRMSLFRNLYKDADISNMVTEKDYQDVASLRSDEAMADFVKLVLASANRFVPAEKEGELAGFVPWFSGSMATQSLQQMKRELFNKSWVLKADGDVADTTLANSADHESANDVRTSADDLGNSLCSDCLLWGALRTFTFNAFRSHAARHPRREAYFRTEDSEKSRRSVSGGGTYWLVKTSDVQVQGSFWSKNASEPSVLNLGALAIGGPFLGGNMLLIRNGDVRWNAMQILRAVPSDFSNGFVTAEYTHYAELISSGMLGNGMEFAFHNGMSLTVNHHDQVLDARFHVCASHVGAGAVEGLCGNFELGRQADDVVNRKASVKLQKKEILFPFDTTR